MGVIFLRSIYLPWLLVLCLNFMTQDLALGQTYRGRARYPRKPEIHSINIRYREAKPPPSLDQNIGLTIAVAPFHDSRHGRLYIGHHKSLRKISNYFKSEPFPLEKAIREFFSEALSHSGIQTIFVSSWDGNPEALKDLEADSILRIDMKRFWIEAEAVGGRTRVNTSFYFDIFLGVKKEKSVLKQKVYVGKEIMDSNFTPEKLENFINRTLSNVFDDFFGSL